MSDLPFSIATTQPNIRPTAFKQNVEVRQLTVEGGNPDDVANPGDDLGGAVTELSTSIVLTEPNQNVFINCRVAGDLNVNSVDFGMILHRSGGTGPSVFLRAPEDGNRGRFITTNVISSNSDFSSGDSMVLTYVDTTTSAGTYIYTPVCVNTGGGDKYYMFNRVQQSNNGLAWERAVSTMVLQVI